MENNKALEAFTALAQATRLDVFRLLVRHEPDGLPAGEIARRLEVPHNTLSVNLLVLNNAGLVASERRSRSIVYRAAPHRCESSSSSSSRTAATATRRSAGRSSRT